MAIARRLIQALTLVVPFAVAGLAQDDVLTVGGPCISGLPGQVINIPVFIRDVSGTRLGVDQPEGNRIDAFAFRVTATPASAIALDATENLKVTVTRAGITASLTPVFENTPRTKETFSYIALYSTNSLPFVTNAPSPGNQVANIAITLSASIATATVIRLTVDTSGRTTALSNGLTTISETADRGGLELVNGCITVFAASPIAVLCPRGVVTTGGTGSGSVIIPAPQSTDTTITLTSSTPTVATVPASVTIPAGSTSASFTVSGIGNGNADITATPPASLGTGSETCSVTVANPTLSLLVTRSSLVAGGIYEARVYVYPGLTTSADVVTLSSSNPSVVTVPSRVVMKIGEISTTFNVAAVAPGAATITAALPAERGGVTASENITVTDQTLWVGPMPPPLSGPGGSGLSAAVGGTAIAPVYLGAPRTTATTITLTSSHPTIATVPESITIPPGSTSAGFEIRAVGVGSATIRATLPSGTAATTSITVTPVIPQLTATALAVGAHRTTVVTLTISQAQTASFTVPVVTSNPAAGVTPASLTVPAGSTFASFEFIGGAMSGQTTIITVTLPAALGARTASLGLSTSLFSGSTLSDLGLLVLMACLGIAGATTISRWGG